MTVKSVRQILDGIVAQHSAVLPGMNDEDAADVERELRDAILPFRGRTVMDERVLMELPEYSSSLPTGVFFGKRWRARTRTGWTLCEYVADPNDRTVAIIERREVLLPPTGGSGS